MRASDLRLLVGHMAWVNRRLLDATERLPPGRWIDPDPPTTRDLRATLVHELDVEWSWRLAIQGRPPEEWASEVELRPEDFGEVASLRRRWEADEAELLGWIDGLSDEAAESHVHPGLSGTPRPLWQFVVHITTHAAQQHADAATLLTGLGQSPGDLGFPEYLSALG